MKMRYLASFLFCCIAFFLIVDSCTKTVTNTKTITVTDTVTVTNTIIDSSINLDSGLLAYYPFNGNVNDSGINKLNGTIYGGVSFSNDLAGNANSAASFDGSTGYILVPDSTGKLQPDAVTVSFFAKVADISAVQDFLVAVDFNTGGALYGAGVNVNGSVTQQFQFGVISNTNGCSIGSSDPKNAVSSANAVVANKWYHFVGIFSKGLQQIFINGVLNTAETRPFTTTNKCSPNASLTIGGFWKNGLQPLNGSMDELRIYNRALNQNEINKLAKPVQ